MGHKHIADIFLLFCSIGCRRAQVLARFMGGVDKGVRITCPSWGVYTTNPEAGKEQAGQSISPNSIIHYQIGATLGGD